MIWWSDFVRVAKLKFLGMTDTLLHTAQTNGTTVTIRWSCEVTPLWKKWIIWCRTQHIEGQHLNITHQIWQLNVFVCLLNNESLILWVEKKRSSQCSSMCPGERMKERVQHSQFWVFPFFFSIIHFIYLEEKLCYFLLGIKYEDLIIFFFTAFCLHQWTRTYQGLRAKNWNITSHVLQTCCLTEFIDIHADI